MAEDKKTLFDNREIVASRIEKEIKEKGYTKSNLCKAAGISRPTLDKLLSCQVTNKSNFDKYIDKIFKVLDIDKSNLLHSRSAMRGVRNKFRMPMESLSELVDIDLNRIKAIEMGEEASLMEYRDIAMVLGISVASLKNENYFETDSSIGIYDLDEDINRSVSSFWGHIGVLCDQTNGYQWFPISSRSREMFLNHYSDPYIVLPCMDNCLLFLNMQNVKKILLLDDACDRPDNVNWDPEVSEGHIPLVVYESLNDYYFSKENMSDKFIKAMDYYIEKYHLEEDTAMNKLNDIKIYFEDGFVEEDNVEFGEYEDLSSFIDYVYSDFDEELYSKTIYYSGTDCQEHILPLNSVSMIVMPLLNVEKAIMEKSEDM